MTDKICNFILVFLAVVIVVGCVWIASYYTTIYSLNITYQEETGYYLVEDYLGNINSYITEVPLYVASVGN